MAPKISFPVLLLLYCDKAVSHARPPDFRRDPEARSALLARVALRTARRDRDLQAPFDDWLDEDLEPSAQKDVRSFGLSVNATGSLPTNSAFEGLLSKFPLPDLKNSMAVALMDEHRYEEATEALREAVSLAPDRAELHYNLGTALSAQSLHHEALAAYESALAIRSEFPAAHFNLARSSLALANDASRDDSDFWKPEARQSRLDTALSHLQLSGSREAKDLTETLKSLEEVFYQLGRKEEAWDAYRQLLALAPYQGLKVRRNETCESLAAWFEDRLLELEEAPTDHIYPEVSPGFRQELCAWQKASESQSSEVQPRTVHSEFQQNGFAKLQRDQIPLSDEATAVVAEYFNAVHKAGGFYRDSKKDPKALLSGSRWSLDGDRLADFLAVALRPVAEEASGKALKLGFAKVAIYEEGAELAPHRDQILNDVSITLVLDSTERGANSASWPLQLLRPPTTPSTDAQVTHTSELFAPIGEGLVFRGRDFLHRRPCCLGTGERSVVLLLHYVPADFPEFRCESMVNVSAANAEDLLLYTCQELTSPGPGEGVRPPVARQRYLLYNPCATNFDPNYCQSQFNNQVVFFLHALSVAKGLGRKLVLPPFMWMENQMAESQQWFPFEHFFDIEALQARFDVIRLEDFLSWEDLAHPGGQKLWYYFYPPYLVEQAPYAFRGIHFKRYMNLSFAAAKRMSPFQEVHMAASGRGSVPFAPKEGRSYWMAARLLLAKLRARSSSLHAREASFFSWLAGDSLEGEEAAMVSQLSDEVEQMKTSLASLDLGPDVQPVEDVEALAAEVRRSVGAPVTAADVLVFDFAPSYNFNFDRFQFDWELRRNRRALRFHPRWQATAQEVRVAIFGDQEYVSLHVRRDGYEHFCTAEESRLAQGRGRKRFGFDASAAVCHPSLEELVESLLLADLSPSRPMFLATNSRNSSEIQRLSEMVLQRFGAATRRLQDFERFAAIPLEAHPVVELLVAAAGSTFVGNAISTFSMNILMERDLLGKTRNSTIFQGLGDATRWAKA